ncbi:hypothetical protein [Streptomyces sp. ICC1]|uniref:hypothetical protein n=1 Tax=Streptomyces sp. ICC1 TaxID=2099583 RepID=UPI000DC776C3|nr:hypothetical protein [Streptomyces sp. ICC1]AWZ17570.1 hypothetical protein DRB96_42085 [Streptomyces sp. ICC1]
MPETDNGVDPRTARPPASPRPTRRGVLAAGAGAAALLLPAAAPAPAAPAAPAAGAGAAAGKRFV